MWPVMNGSPIYCLLQNISSHYSNFCLLQKESFPICFISSRLYWEVDVETFIQMVSQIQNTQKMVILVGALTIEICHKWVTKYIYQPWDWTHSFSVEYLQQLCCFVYQMQEWLDQKLARSSKSYYVMNQTDFDAVPDDADYLLGRYYVYFGG